VLGICFPRLLDIITVKQVLYETASMEVMLSIYFDRRYLEKNDLLREWQCVCGVKVVDRPTALTQILTCLDASLDITIGFVNSFGHAHTGREVARNGS
jgi:hypothetical protein